MRDVRNIKSWPIDINTATIYREFTTIIQITSLAIVVKASPINIY